MVVSELESWMATCLNTCAAKATLSAAASKEALVASAAVLSCVCAWSLSAVLDLACHHPELILWINTT